MGGKKGGQADQSGMLTALVSAQAADKAYQLGNQQLDWTKQQWNTEWPYMQQIAQSQVNTQNQLSDFSRNQQSFYETQYQPMETALNKEITQWASPQNIALQTGQAAANVAEAVNAQKASAQEQLEGYGVNPGATRFDSLDKAIAVQAGAAEAGAGTAAGMATRMQGMQLMGQAVNTGRGFPNAVSTLSGTGTQAGAAGTSGLTTGLGTMSTALTNPSAWYNAGANNMSVYTGAVNGYNQAQVGFAQANAMEMAGLGSAVGGMAGMFAPIRFAEKGGPIEKYDDGGDVNPTGFNMDLAKQSEGFGGGFGQGMNAARAQRTAILSRMARQVSANSNTGATAYDDGGTVNDGDLGIGAMPGRYFQAGPAQQPVNNNQQPAPIPPQNGTPGGVITPQMSPSQGQVPDDVDAKLTVGEFVMPLDVVRFKGKEYFYKQIDSARKQEAIQSSRGDIGGEPTAAMPSRNPAFVSRPNSIPPQGVPAGIPIRAQKGGPSVQRAMYA